MPSLNPPCFQPPVVEDEVERERFQRTVEHWFKGVEDFIHEHDRVFIVEQNRDAQMRSMLVNELEVDPGMLTKVLHYDGTPITARFITQAITNHVHALAVSPRRERVS